MTQDRNYTFMKTLRGVLVATMMVLASGNVMAQTSTGVRVNGNVYGGGNAADVGVNATVNIAAGTMVNVYGGGKGQNTTVVGDVRVNIGKFTKTTTSGTETVTGVAKITGSVYGGSALGTVNAATTKNNETGDITNRTPSESKSTSVNIYRSTINGSVYGGGEGDSDTEAQVCKGVTVTVGSSDEDDAPTIEGSVYGGCNANGVLWEKSEVNVVRGTIGTQNEGNLVDGTGNVHGGGFGQKTLVKGDVEVNIGKTDGAATPTYSGFATIHGDVYGGSAKGNVNAYIDTNDDNKLKQTVNTTTQVNLYGSTSVRDIYGGGLGELGNENESHDDDIPADVYGNVTVSVYGGTARNVFGCNNVYGTPKGTVNVNVTGTGTDAKDATNKMPYLTTTDSQLDAHTFDIAGVYGGGNQATYTPAGDQPTTVTISGCDRTSIKEVYGGGKAADVPGCAVNVNGSFEIGYVYTGGNGTETVPANVLGNAITTIRGGTIYRTFGGSNTNGSIGDGTTTGSTLYIADANTNETCQQAFLGDVFSYGNRATMNNPATVTMGCLANKVGALYGGAMNADINSNLTLTINSGTYANVFGGNKSSGTIKGYIKVNIEQTDPNCLINIDNLYGCGNDAAYTTAYTDNDNATQYYEDPEINIISCTNIGNVYGGGYGSNAIVTGNPKVNINMVKSSGQSELGIIGNVYGGGYGANVTGNTTLNIGTAEKVTLPSNSTSVDVVGANITGDVFGGGYGHETTVSGTATINIGEKKAGETEGTYTYVDHGALFSNTSNIYGGSALGTVATTQVNLYAGTIAANVFGGGKGRLASGTPNTEGYQDAQSATVTTANVSLYEAIVTGNIYGGCNDNGTTTTAVLDLIGGTIGTSSTAPVADKVFGGGQGHLTTTTNATVNIGTVDETATPNTYAGSSNIYSIVYGGSALGAVGIAIVNLNKATILTGDVFGGGMGSGSDEAHKATVTSATVNQNNVTLASGNIYGGCNVNGTATTTEVNLMGGSVTDVYGGGLGQNTGVTGDVSVNVGKYENNAITGNPTITRDVYGGSAKGSVNKQETATTKTTTTTVNLLAGTINGDVYGGGLGVKPVTADPANNIAAVDGIEAHVYGNVLVSLNEHSGTCKVGGAIFGCNNANGSPEGHVTVHVYGTTDRDGQGTNEYDLSAVYGGGNEADYVPTDAKQSTEVNIEGCGTTKIQNVYGGGNAAAVPATEVWILGSDILDNVYGGGNGELGPNYAAHVGFHRTSATTKSDYTSGEGKTYVKLVAGNINNVYGGSNSNGDIRVEANVTMPQLSAYTANHEAPATSGCCDKLVSQHIYGGGNAANMEGDVNIILECMPEDYVDAVYGGAQNASIDGDVTLTVTSGKFGRVFGGNNAGGNIKGAITVNVYEEGCKPLKIGELYGGGNAAPYSIYGCEEVSGQWKANKEGTLVFDQIEKDRAAIQVNVYSCTSIGKIYGGGMGESAEVIGNTHVWVNMMKGLVGEVEQPLGKIGQVFGGGKAAKVIGDTRVDIGTVKVSKDKNNQPVEDVGVKIESGSDYISPLSNTTLEITEAGVYGGGEAADVVGNTTLNIGTEDLTLKTTINGNIFGGGLGSTTKVTGNVNVNIGTNESGSPVGYAIITGDVYGGSAMGTVNTSNGTSVNTYYPDPNDNTITADCYTKVNLYGGTLNGSVYGGGLGDNTSGSEVAANVYGPVTVTVEGGSAQNVFGCNNKYGAPQQNTVTVNINGTAEAGVGNVYGGGNQAAYAGSPVVTMNGGKAANIFGGGLSADVGGSVTVNMKAGNVTNDVYGGGALASTNIGNTTDTSANTTKVFLLGGTINHNVYGGGLGEKNLVNGATADKPAYVNGDVKVYLNGMEVADYDATNYSALVTAVDVEQDNNVDYYHSNDNTGCVVKGSIFGCNNLCGTPKGQVKVHIFKTQGDGESHKKSTDKKGGSYELTAVYGGGNMAAYEPTISGTETEANHAHTDVVIEGCDLTSIQYVYGGGNAASTPSTNVTVNGSYEIGEVFGGGNGADKVPISYNSLDTQDNPGANVGFKEYGAAWGTYTNPYATKENRAQYYGYGFGRAQVNINGGLVHAVYGGSNSKGNVREVAIAMLDHVEKSCTFKVDEAYGGGKSADMDGKAILKLGCIPSIGEVYGGARNANVSDDVVLTITNGTYDRVFGGNNEGGTISGTITVNIEETGCEPIIIGQLFGGGNQAAYTAPAGKSGPVLNVRSFTSIGEIYGGGFGSTAKVTGDINIKIDEAVGDHAIVYEKKTLKFNEGQSNEYEVVIPAHTAGKIGTIGDIYGGGYGADVIGDVTVDIGTQETIKFETKPATMTITADTDGKYPVHSTGVDIARSIYGGGYGAATTVTGNVKVNVGGEKADGSFIGGDIAIGGSVYGGSALGAVNATRDSEDETKLNPTANATTTVTLKKGNVTRYVFGGGQGNANTTAHVYGKSTVTLYGDVVAGGLYGGCDANGKMHSDTQLDLLGGTVGTVLGATDPIPDMVFGGGLGQATTVNGDVTVNVGKSVYTGNTSVTIWGNVYGGGALGDVNTGTNNTTLVNLFKGKVNGNVFGGGLGQEAKAAVGTEGTEGYQPAVSEVAAEVKGNATVKLNENNGICEVTGSIFGCNNTKGSPKGHVLVHVFKTVKAGNIKDPTNKPNLDDRWSADATYDMNAVYGGGNRADYEPTSEAEFAEVIIDGCDDTSIKEVYGGGYGAAVPATQVKILGAYLINEVFGGGYGAGDNNPGANVGYYTYTDEANKTAYTVGNGKAQVKLYGGKVHTAYGGSNTKGNIRGGSSAGKATDIAVTCSLQVKNIYGAGKNADQDGGTDLVIGCIPGLVNVYGGAKDANVKGGVNLVITGGDFDNVFGGNDTSGTIQGPIKLYIEESCDAIRIKNLYLGGNQAAYSVYGYYKDSNGDLQPRKSKTDTPVVDGTIAPDATTGQYEDPQLYVTKFTKIDNVYGGGFGKGAVMYGNPTVNINEVKNLAGNLGEIGNVYGGGDAANVEGNTTVNIGTETVVEIHADGKNAEDAWPTADVHGANITGNVYGGGNLADVTGNTQVNICAKEVTVDENIEWQSVAEGASKVIIAGDVFGAGKGVSESPAGMTPALTSTQIVQSAAVKGNSFVYMGGGWVKSTVYGGGELASVGDFTYDTDNITISGINNEATNSTTGEKEAPTGTATVNIFGGKVGPEDMTMPTFDGHVFGAGKGITGSNDLYPKLNFVNKTEVTISGTAFVMGSVYGGSENGHVRGNTLVNIQGGQIGAGFDKSSGKSLAKYDETAFINPATDELTNALATCASWPYDVATTGKPYDPYHGTDDYNSEGGATASEANDGHTFYGNVFGGGSGYFPYAAGEWLESAGSVGGNTVVNISAGHILSSVYGGNEMTNVEGSCTVNMSGGTVGVPRTKTQIENHPVIGNLFGAGKGDKRVLFNTLTNVASTSVNITGGIVYGSVFGGGEDGHVLEDATTKIEQASGKTITIGSTGESGADGNVFGGGRGSTTSLTAGVVGGNVGLTINSGTILGSVYGGGRLAAVGTHLVETNNNNYGKLQDDTSTETHGHITLTINGGTIGTANSTGVSGNVFGGSKGTETNFNLGIARSTTINMTGGTAYASVYGGGELAQVVGSHTTDGKALGTEINISGGTIGISGKGAATWGNVYGGGKGNLTHPEAGLIKTNTLIKVENGTNTTPTIYHNIYGGGAYGSVGTITYSTDTNPATYVPNHASVVNMPMAWAENTGKAEVYIYGGTFGVDGKENGMIFASSRGDVAIPEGATVDAPYGTDVDVNDRLAWVHDTKLVIGGEGKSPTIYGSAYGSGENGHVFADANVEIHNGTIGVTANDALGGPDYRLRGNVYGGGCGEDTYEVGTGENKKEYFNPLAGIVRGTATVTIDGGQVVHNVYGAGALGSVVGKTTVTIARNAIIGVDGGAGGSVFGAARGKEGVTVPGSNLANSPTSEVNINGGQIWNSVYGGGEAGYVKQGVVVNMTGGTVAKDVYGGGALADTNTDNWNPTGGTDGKGAWAEGKTSASSTTIVNLLGGTIGGDAYGGGLGRLAATGVTAIEAKVFGDVAVNLGKADRSTATAFEVNKYTEGTHAGIVKSGRVFGCNNLNGSPQGTVTVTVNKTVEGNTPKTASGDLKSEVATKHSYHVAAVYGGGNLAGKTVGGSTNVIINGCDVSIRDVYGGGNAAEVPATDVLVNGAYEIGEVFGGGNGKDDYTLDGGTTWTTNPGANVNGNTNTLLQGGFIHEAYGGSNEKGTITGSVSINTGSGQPADCSDCPLDVEKIVGAGKNADVNGDLIMILGCKPETKTPLVFGGADNANVNGNVELTITSGTFGQVFGGNNLGGVIRGHIILNIEETGCNPIKIDSLYLGGNQAAYSIYGYYNNGSEENPDLQPRTAAMEAVAKTDPNYIAPVGNPVEDADHPFPYKQPVLNVVSCTSIGKIFGGGLGKGAVMHADPTVNINMIPGAFANDQAKGVPAVMTAKGLSSGDNPNNLGIIGDVYGGGNEADVIGNTTVNIGTASKVQLHESLQADGKTYQMSGDKDVKGAYITGSVFGGGKGKADTFTCEKAMIGEDGDGVAHPEGGTNVTIGNGTVCGDVYGGGEIGRVEKNTVVTIGKAGDADSAPVVEGDVFGGGKGLETHGYAALVRGNPVVTVQGNAKVKGSIYGGGEIASVGRFWVNQGANNPAGAPTPPTGTPIGMPYALKDENSGTCTVIIKDNAEIGPDDMQMPTFTGHVFGAGKGILPGEYDYLSTDQTKTYTGTKPQRMNNTSTMEDFGTEPDYITFIETLAITGGTRVTIGGNAFVKGSVYGGSENGHVLHDTKVNIEDKCQIGNGFNKTTNKGVNKRYSDSEWSSESLYECASWPYGQTVGTNKMYHPYDVYDLDANNKPKTASDGHTFYGNVFGGGSGYFPYRRNPAWVKDDAKSTEVGQPVDKNGYSDGIWLRSAGAVYGKTEVNITGGHILTSVYGGNECTDVGKYLNNSITPEAGTGTCTVNMTGGTVGVPRTLDQIKTHPVTCYVFGAGKGDQRINFNTWTNVASTQVNISGNARIFGSTFGGGEDGHVIGNAETNISGNAIIGTTGTSYVDGNVFGGGRGFSGDAQTAGTVGGNVNLTIRGGTMLGSIYGGGRLASVGTVFEFPTLANGDPNPQYGQFREDGDGKTYGHITIDITGGTIGNEKASGDGAKYSGNVFGGSMGRLELLNGTRSPIWPKMAQVKSTTVNISGNNTVIRRSVYGGGELGTVRDDATVTINGGTVRRDVFGGGYGSEDKTHTIFSVQELKEGATDPNVATNYEPHTYAFTPMQFAGCVGKSTTVNVSGGYIRKSVYGGGEMASVGVIDYRAAEATSEPAADKVKIGPIDGKTYYYENIVKHGDETKEFVLSWPYEFKYVTGFEGATHVNITGGRLGLKDGDEDDGFDDNGDVYGAGKGKAGDYKDYLFCANVGSTDVKIAYPSTPTAYSADGDLIAGAVYGGGEDGHVMGDTKLTISGGLVNHSLYGAGSGKGKFKATLKKIGKEENYEANIYSITAGKVFGNSTVEMSGGYVVRNIYGGGNMGSVGKGNYAGGADDYSTAGYGEKVDGNLWDGSNKFSTAFLNSGKCTVKITGGTIGYIASDPSSSMYPWNSTASLPYGNVFGGCRGESAPNISETPRYLYSPEFFVGYANETEVTIEGANTKILGSVYGGGMDGHVRRDAHVIINGGEIGLAYNDANKTLLKTEDINNIQWLARGNVYGSGSGIGTYKYDFDYDGKYTSTVTYNGKQTKEEDFSTSAGSVTRFTKVEIKGGSIYRNVYGGGSLSSIGAPKIGQTYNLYSKDDASHSTEVGKQTLNEVIISGGQIGETTGVAVNYGGHMFGGSRGDASLDNSMFSTSMFTKVNIDGGKVLGSVFGGGEVGIVKGSVAVNVTGGEVAKDIYGGGALANTNTENWNPTGGTDGKGGWAAGQVTDGKTTYTTTVNLLGGTVDDVFGGALGQRVGDVTGGTKDIEAFVYGDVNVNLNGLEASDYVSTAHGSFVDPLDKDANNAVTSYRANDGCIVKGEVYGCNNINGTPKGHAKVHVFKTKAKDGQAADDYDVANVFGGGNNADYVPADTKQATEVIIEGCDLTSIHQVYGGGNAAASPGTSVLVKGTKIIYEVFGGGNGEAEGTKAHVGKKTADDSDYDLGEGKAEVQLMAGNVTYVYGGSNTHGDIRGGSYVTNVTKDNSLGCCEKLNVKEIFAGGKNADMIGGAKIVMGCTNSEDWVEEIYAGAKAANVGGDVSLTLTSGKFGRVFGGNKDSGVLDGSITVNIEENAKCGIPLIIGELYGGGNKAAYSIYGYNADGTVKTSGENPKPSPVVNVRAFTSIGNIFGGGYGSAAEMHGSPTININVVNNNRTTGSTISTAITKTFEEGTENEYTVTIPTHEDRKIGAINNVYGGGNAAKVWGDTNVNIGTEAKQKLVKLDDTGNPLYTDAEKTIPQTEEMDVVGADIRGNVYGGGNAAEVTGNTNVVIGKDGTAATQ